MGLVLICDFDGTVVDIDTVEFLLERFAEGDWRTFDLLYERGEITLEECMQRQFSMLRAPKPLMLRELEKAVFFRSGFKALAEYCRIRRIPLVVASAGLDFVIRHFLEREGWGEPIEVYAAKTVFTEEGIELTFPGLMDETSADFKEDLVKHYKGWVLGDLYRRRDHGLQGGQEG